jgi:hypothetical protein
LFIKFKALGENQEAISRTIVFLSTSFVRISSSNNHLASIIVEKLSADITFQCSSQKTLSKPSHLACSCSFGSQLLVSK